MTTYTGPKLKVEYHLEFIDTALKDELIDLILPLLISKYGKLTRSKRYNICFGNDYKIIFNSIELTRNSIKQDDQIWWPPSILRLKTTLEEYTGDTYNTCFIQYYPNGNVGISKHFDSEVRKNTTIASVSLGATRTFKLMPGKYISSAELDLKLEDKSVLILHPPTNGWWLHSLEPDQTDDWRLSIIFRDNGID